MTNVRALAMIILSMKSRGGTEMDNDATRKNGLNVPIWERSTLTVEEAAAYSGIGRNKLRSITDKEDCDFVLWVGSKRLIKRKLLDKFIDESYSI